MPTLYQEPKEALFSYLKNEATQAEAREVELGSRYHLHPLKQKSTRLLYRKNLYLLDMLEKMDIDLSGICGRKNTLKALDIGSQDWHYVFALERWLRFSQAPEGRNIHLQGLELDGYGIYSDFHSRLDYGLAYTAQTGNPDVSYSVGDFLKHRGSDYDFLTLFFPFVTRRAMLLWGLPLHFFKPKNFVIKAAECLSPGGLLLVWTHSALEHQKFLELGHDSGKYELLKAGQVISHLVDFYPQTLGRHYSLWQRH